MRWCYYDLSFVCYCVSVLPGDHIKRKMSLSFLTLVPVVATLRKTKAWEREQKNQSIKEVSTTSSINRISNNASKRYLLNLSTLLLWDHSPLQSPTCLWYHKSMVKTQPPGIGSLSLWLSILPYETWTLSDVKLI